MIVLFCPEVAQLTLGPGAAPEECIQFKDGWAHVDPKKFPEWKTWVNAPGTPIIEVIPEDAERVPETTPNAFVCPVCGKAFSLKVALTGHLRSHAPKG